MDTTRLRVGMVGLGLAFTPHYKGYASHPQADVVALCDLDSDRVLDYARRYGVPQTYTSFEAMLAEAELDVVDITTPTFLHASMTQQAAALGKHVLCEKPFCRNLAEGLQACDVARRTGVTLMVGETYCFISSHMKARELIESGEIGRPLTDQTTAWGLAGPEKSRPLIRGRLLAAGVLIRPNQAGGDYPWIFDHAVHFFAAAEFFMLDQPIAEIYALTASGHDGAARRGAGHDPYQSSEVDIPIITWKFDDPACQGVWMRAERLNRKYDYQRGFSTTIIGEHGMIEVLGEGGHNMFWEGPAAAPYPS